MKEVPRRHCFHPHVGRCEITRLMSLLSYVKHISYPLDYTNSIIDAQMKVYIQKSFFVLLRWKLSFQNLSLLFAMMDASSLSM